MDAATRSGGGVSAIVEYDYTAKEPDELDLMKGAMIHNVKQMPGGWWEGTLNSNGKTGMFPDNFVRVIDMNEETTVTLRDKSATANRRCKVIYSYTQVNDDELSLAVGDVIEFLGEVEEGWWRGRLKTKVGVFPSNFVVAIEHSPILASKRPPSSSVAPTSAQATSAAKTSAASSNNLKLSSTTNSAAAAALAALSTKKTNRLSFHSSKEDLLNFTTSSSSASSATTTTATTAVEDVAPSLPPKPQRDFCRVEYPYAPQNEDELELKVGDVITVISMELADKGWWKGELRGKVGVFPDNFVKLMATSEVSPLHEPQQSHRTAKNSKTTAATSLNSTNITSSATSSTTISNSTAAAATTSKVFIKKSGSTSSTQSSNRKDSFGSRDSLNDILSETGLPSGNVAAQRKSLENKNLDLSNAPDASTRLGLKKQPLQQLQETKTILNSSSNNSSISTITTTTSSSISTGMTSNLSAGDLRKSLENMDEKTKSPPPVLTKKPSVPTKKSTTVTSVAGNLLSGLKQKVKNVENKLTTAASHDAADGIGSSKMSPGGLPDSGPSGHVVMRRAATIAVEDSDFDRVERSSILPDMRAGRVKAPKRRPPSAAINVIGESNNNNSIYLNGSGGGTASGSELLYDDTKPQSSDDNSTGEEQLAKPKPREWEKKKAPWMEELKASQVKKKTSPNVEPRTIAAGGTGVGVVGGNSLADRTSKLLGEDMKITSSSSSHMGAGSTVIASSSSTTSSNVSSSTSTKVQSSSISSSIMQQSMMEESSQQLIKKELSSASATDAMTKSMINKHANEATTTTVPPVPSVEDVRARPNSLSIRNRSISPSLLGTRTTLKASASSNVTEAPASSSTTLNNSNSSSSSATTTSNNSSSVTSTAAKTTIVNNHHHHSSTIHENNIMAAGSKHSVAPASGGEGGRVVELEKRVEKLESVVHAQQRTIDELVRTLREETDRVKVLRGELDKYAQCVTQV